MAWARGVVLVLAGVWCTGVVGGVPNTAAVSAERNERREQVNVPPPLTSCQGINSLLRLLRSALEDLRSLQESYSSEGRLVKARHRVKERARAAQWARKLRRRLLRLCPRQSTAYSLSSRTAVKLWASAVGGYLVSEAVHGDRPVRTLPLRRSKLSHLLDVLRSLFPRQEQTTTTTTPSHGLGGTKGNDLEAEDKEVEDEEDSVEVKKEINSMETESDEVEEENDEEKIGENIVTKEEENDSEEEEEEEEVKEKVLEEVETEEKNDTEEVEEKEKEGEVEEKNETEEVEESEENAFVDIEDSVEDDNLKVENETDDEGEEVDLFEVEEDVVEVAVEVGVEELLRTVPDTFLSLALSPRLMERGWLNFNTSSPRLLTLVGALAPAILRVGGTAANFLTYDPTPAAPSGAQLEGGGRESQEEDDDDGQEGSGEEEEEMRTENEIDDDVQGSGKREKDGSGDEERSEGKDIEEEKEDGAEEGGGGCSDKHIAQPTFTNFTITSGDWRQLLHFTRAVGMQLLFDLNQFYRGPGGDWDPANARLLLRDACTSGFTSVTWQLGNEPNSYRHKYGFVLSAEQTARDYGILLKMLEEECPAPARLVGPDVTRPKRHHPHPHPLPQAGLGVDSMGYLESFLTASTVNLTAVTWHQYYINGHNANKGEFLNPTVMDKLEWQMDQVVKIRDRLALGKPIWLTESSSAWGGGAHGLSDAFVAGFLWLDKLGVAARGGVEVVARQTLYQACYALLRPDLTPNPDYWLSLLYKRLVGGRVLSLKMPSAPPSLRLYAHCLHPHAHAEGGPEGGVVVLGMNLGTRALRVSLGDKLAASPVMQYLLQPVNGELKARQVLLNGVQLQLGPRGELPSLDYASLPPGPFTLPPTSLGFWVLPRVRAPACL